MLESCRSRKMLKNDYLVAKIGVDTAENGRVTSGAGADLEGLRTTRSSSPWKSPPSRSSDGRVRRHAGQILAGSFSAVSKPLFSMKS